jgi:hypothetical protein
MHQTFSAFFEGTRAMKLSFGQSARELGLLYAHIRALSLAGKIKYETVGNFKFIDRADLPAVRQAAIEAGYIQQNASPDPKNYPAWLRAMGWNDGEAGLSEKARANLYAWFMAGNEPIDPAEPNEAAYAAAESTIPA